MAQLRECCHALIARYRSILHGEEREGARLHCTQCRAGLALQAGVWSVELRAQPAKYPSLAQQSTREVSRSGAVTLMQTDRQLTE